jgi:gliding motility-associated-like protein
VAVQPRLPQRSWIRRYSAATISGSTNVNCFGGSDGTAAVSVTGGTGSYSYLWSSSPADTLSTVSGLSANISYTVTVTDSLGCTDTDNITLSQPAAALASLISSQINVDCFSNASGTVTVSTTGGTTPYQFTLDSANGPWQSDSTFAGLTAGSYTVYVRDTNGCSTNVPVTISQPTAPLASSILTQTQVDCFGNASGSVTVSTSGGTPAYQFSITSAAGPWQSDSTFSGLVDSSYTVFVLDALGCTTQVGVTITEPAAPLSSMISAQTNVNCFSSSTGAVTVSTSGGTTPYQFSLVSATGPWQSDSSFTSLPQGSYTVYVRDTNGCATQVSVTITEPPTAVDVSVSSHIDVSCFGGANGQAVAVGSGGTGTLTYTWNTVPPQVNDTATGLSAGSYQVIATDALGCSDSVSVTLSEPAQTVTATITSSTDVRCFGDSTGFAFVLAAGGTTPYTYLWGVPPPPGQTTPLATNLPAGTYDVIVTDSLGCTDTATVTISQPSAALSVNILFAQPPCHDFTNGSAQAVPSGGTSPYTYLWSTTDVTDIISNLGPGTYSVTVTDSLGCFASGSQTLVNPPPISTNAGADSTVCEPPGMTLNADPVPANFTGHWDTDTNGTAIFANAGSPNSGVSSLTTGPNILIWTITDNITGCFAVDTVVVTREIAGKCYELELPTGYTPNGDSHNDDYDIHGIENYPENQFKVFNRWGNEVYSKLNYVNHDWKGQNNSGDDLPDGTYFVILVIQKSDIVRTTYVDMRR